MKKGDSFNKEIIKINQELNMNIITNINKFGFLLSNNKYVKYLLLDGYEVGDLKMDGFMIRVGLDNEGRAIAWLSEEDKKILKNIEYQEELKQAAEMLKKAIENKSFALFTYNPKEVFNQNGQMESLISARSWGSELFFSINEEHKDKLPFIVDIYNLQTKKYPKPRITDFERTVESLNMINFIKDFDSLNIKVVTKYS